MSEFASLKKRAWAWIIDACIVALVTVPPMFLYLWELSYAWAAWMSVTLGLLPYAYKVVMQAIWGQTIGKRLLGIRLRRWDDTAAGWRCVILRYLPGIVFAVAAEVGWCVAVRSAGWERLQTANAVERARMMEAELPMGWNDAITWIPLTWLLVNFVVAMNTMCNRALHDLLAGTVVWEAPLASGSGAEE